MRALQAIAPGCWRHHQIVSTAQSQHIIYSARWPRKVLEMTYFAYQAIVEPCTMFMHNIVDPAMVASWQQREHQHVSRCVVDFLDPLMRSMLPLDFIFDGFAASQATC